MNIHCPQCHTQYRHIPEKFRHKKVVCKKCGFRFLADDTPNPDMPQETRLADPVQTARAAQFPQETRLAESAPSAQAAQFPQETKMAEPAEHQQAARTEKSLGSYSDKVSNKALSRLAKVLGKGSEYLLQQTEDQQHTLYDWQVGDVILNLYEVRSLLGEGQFGKVYQVRHRNWHLDLALKTPKPKALSAGAENIIKEAETWVNLPLHPNIVNCYYVRAIDGIPQIFSEYVNGEDLKQLIKTRKLYQGKSEQILSRILDIAIQFAWGLYFAHKQGLVHQDIKPANVMLSRRGVAKITDFGLARLNLASDGEHKSQTLTGMGMTPAYASPEQLADKPLSRYTDIWSWAVCVLEMIIGYCSWEAGAIAPGILEAYLNKELEEPPALPSIPAELEQILAQCFEEQEDLRPDNMLILAQELVSVYRHHTGKVYPRSVPQTGSETASSYNNQAISLVDLACLDDAEQLWQKALAIEPQHFESIHNLSLLQWQTQGMEESIILEKLQDLFNKTNPEKNHLNGLARLFIQFGQFEEAIKHINKNKMDFSSLPEPSEQYAHIELALALCARYRQDKDTRHWQYIVDCLKPAILKKTDDPYIITAYTLALHKSRQKQLAQDYYKTIRDRGIIPVSFKQAVATFLPGYEVLYQLSVMNSVGACFANNNTGMVFSQANKIIFWDIKEARRIKSLTGHSVKITAIKYASEQSCIISASQQGNIRIWDSHTGRQLNVWFAHESAVTALDLSPCGQFLVTSAKDQKLCLWDVKQCQSIAAFYGEGHDAQINDIKFSPDGKSLLSASADKMIRIWDVTSGKTQHILSGHQYEVLQVFWVNDQTIVSASKDKTIRIWILSNNRGAQVECSRILRGHRGSINSLCVSSRQQYLVSGSSDGQVRYWDLGTGQSIHLHQFSEPVIHLSLDTSDRFVMVLTQHGISILEVENPFRYQAALLFSLPQSAQKIDKLQGQYQKKIQLAALKLQQKQYHDAKNVLEQARQLEGYKQDKTAYKYWTSLYLKLPVSRLGDVWQYKEHTTDMQRINGLCASDFDHCFYTADHSGSLVQWQQDSFESKQLLKISKPISHIELTQDNKLLLYACEKDLHLVDIKSGELLSSFNHHEANVTSVVLTPDGRFVLSSDSRGGCFIWRLLTGELTSDFSNAENVITSLAITPDGQNFVCAYINNSNVHIRDIQTGRVITELDEHEKAVSSIFLSLDGQEILTASVDASLRLWRFKSRHKKSLRVFHGHGRRIYQAVMDGQKKIAVSISEDRTLKIWHLNNAQCLYTFNSADADFSCVTITPDSQYIIAGKTDGTLMSWCLDWELEQQPMQEWPGRADIFIRNYLLSRKVTETLKEVPHVMGILSRAGFGLLNKEDVLLHLNEAREALLQDKILTGSIRTTGTKITGKSRNKSGKQVWAVAAGFVLLSVLFLFWGGNQGDDSPSSNTNSVVLDNNEQITVEKMLVIGMGLAQLNRQPVIVNNRVDVHSLLVPDDVNKLKQLLNLETSQWQDAWEQPFQFAGIKNGAFKGRVVLRSSGRDRIFKTDDDILLNGYPYRASLSVRKNNQVIIRLSDVKTHHIAAEMYSGADYEIYEQNNESAVEDSTEEFVNDLSIDTEDSFTETDIENNTQGYFNQEADGLEVKTQVIKPVIITNSPEHLWQE